MIRGVTAATAAALMMTTLTGCGAARMHLRYGELSSKVEMSESVFLDPLNGGPATVYLTEASSSGEEISVRPGLDRALRGNGYSLVDSPEEATYLIQLNHLQLIEHELSANETVGDAIGSAWAAGGVTALGAALLGAEGAAAELGLAVGIVAFILDAKTKHIALTLTTVLITEVIDTDGGPEVRTHETRIIAGASKVNLRRTEALPALVSGVTRSMIGTMPPRAGS